MYGGDEMGGDEDGVRVDFQDIDCLRRDCDTTYYCMNAYFLPDSSPCSGNAGWFVPREKCEVGLFGEGSATHSPMLVCFKDPFPDFRVMRGFKDSKARHILTGRAVHVRTCIA